MFRQPLYIQQLKRLCEILTFQTAKFNVVSPEKIREISQMNIKDPEQALSMLAGELKQLKCSLQ